MKSLVLFLSGLLSANFKQKEILIMRREKCVVTTKTILRSAFHPFHLDNKLIINRTIKNYRNTIKKYCNL